MIRKKNPHWGTTLDGFLAEEGIRGAAFAVMATRMLALQLRQEIKRKRLTEPAAANRMRTSPAQLDRVLNAKGSVTFDTLLRSSRPSSAASCALNLFERPGDALPVEPAIDTRATI